MSAANPITPESPKSLNRLLLWVLLATLILAILWACTVFSQNFSDTDTARFRENVKELTAGKTNLLLLTGIKKTDSLLEEIRGMPEIEAVYLDNSNITVVGMRHLGSLPNLKNVEAYPSSKDTGICDEGLLERRNCTKLESVLLYHAPISDEAIAELRHHIPNVRVSTKHDEGP